jgi:hypothetical protein
LFVAGEPLLLQAANLLRTPDLLTAGDWKASNGRFFDVTLGDSVRARWNNDTVQNLSLLWSSEENTPKDFPPCKK